MFLVRAAGSPSSLPGLPAQVCVPAAGWAGGLGDRTLVLSVEFIIKHAPEQLAWLSVDEYTVPGLTWADCGCYTGVAPGTHCQSCLRGSIRVPLVLDHSVGSPL